MTLVHVDTDIVDAELVDEDDYLDSLAATVRREYRRSREAMGEALDAYFAIGNALLAARQALPSDNSFGAWFRGQEFGFTQQWAHVLRTAAEHEPEVRELVTTQVVTGNAVNFKKAVKQVRAALGGGRDDRPNLAAINGGHDEPVEPATTPDLFSAIVIDPPWRYDNVVTRGAAEDHYPTMSLDELAALTIPAAEDSHLYLWVTAAFMRDGFDLLNAWGFTYKTVLTWCKPSIGMGNYFRVNTEHVLFAVRGRCPTLRNNEGTWFTAPRTRHSAKPESFYDLVERCSPGPWLEMFARRRRFRWHVWGNEA